MESWRSAFAFCLTDNYPSPPKSIHGFSHEGLPLSPADKIATFSVSEANDSIPSVAPLDECRKLAKRSKGMTDSLEMGIGKMEMRISVLQEVTAPMGRLTAEPTLACPRGEQFHVACGRSNFRMA